LLLLTWNSFLIGAQSNLKVNLVNETFKKHKTGSEKLLFFALFLAGWMGMDGSFAKGKYLEVIIPDCPKMRALFFFILKVLTGDMVKRVVNKKGKTIRYLRINRLGLFFRFAAIIEPFCNCDCNTLPVHKLSNLRHAKAIYEERVLAGMIVDCSKVSSGCDMWALK